MSDVERVVLILVGLVGSGKTAFATALQHHFPNRWRRCNQDELGNRRQVEALARDSLRKGFSVCIDRTNIDESQRAHWINIAREFSNTSVWIIVFDTPYDVCASRLRDRTSHPTIHSFEQGLSILSRFANDFRPPTAEEDFNRIISLELSDTKPDYSALDISIILERVRSSAVVSGGSTPVRTSWAERRRASGRGLHTKADNRRPYGDRHITSDSSTDSARGANSFFGKLWEQGTGVVFQTQSSGTSAVEASSIEAGGGLATNYDTQNSPPLEEARYLSDSLGVD
ncbi:P-loop containing nucleoside triphosphate hydrolase protein [Rhodocollybia butyracea]|uniref:P-loop containing nucleoside triphosphate hydrolase protein n=1 Tax=Rhodocollybia butyracea TaxID=206335 RepID=A0A9P5QAG9_9AGAR|nr:P-loop containing nucleoside triphosphate hydrolase protein [Rhodocollybia butyracea]